MSRPYFHDLRTFLPPPLETLAILVGCLEATVFGLGGLTAPVDAAKSYGLPVTPSSASSSQKHPGAIAPDTDTDTSTVPKEEASGDDRAVLFQALAARHLQHGAMVAVLGLYVGNRRALGVAVLSGFFVTVADVLLVRKHGVKDAAWLHGFGAGYCLLVGGGLLGYFKR